uniref:Protein-lysine N-methyltransferase n=1 Tax=Globodera rostochiensis TaxID=31243 RepID=A0A914IAP7_GLORO
MAAEAGCSPPDFEHSKLGTKEYWDNLYSVELANFADNGDEGEIWFGLAAELRILKFVEQNHLSVFTKICDLGTGNGALLRKLRSRGFSHLVGIDYSAKAIELAHQASSCQEQNAIAIQFRVADLTSDRLDIEFHNKFELVIDKGTFDAISLGKNRQKALENYCQNVGQMFCAPNDSTQTNFFLIISCNFTIEELIAHFVKMPCDKKCPGGTFQFVGELPDAPQPFKFGGKIGKTTGGAVFRWHPSD